MKTSIQKSVTHPRSFALILAASISISGVQSLHAAEAAVPAQDACTGVYLKVGKQAAERPSDVLEITSSYVRQFPQCGCEVVKAAILSAKNQGEALPPKSVAAIVEAAMNSAGEEHWSSIVQCALAVAPDCVNAIRSTVMALAPGNSKLGSMFESGPLDMPGGGSAMPTGVATPPAIVNPPVIVNPPRVTEVDPGGPGLPVTPPGKPGGKGPKKPSVP